MITAASRATAGYRSAFFFHPYRVQPDIVLETSVGNDAEEAVIAEGMLEGRTPPALETLQQGAITRLRRLVRRSMVLQVLRLRAVAATGRFTRTAGPPEPPLQSYAAHPAPRIARGLAVTRQVVELRRLTRRPQGRAPPSC